jgi:predicted metalloendopeptidase
MPTAPALQFLLLTFAGWLNQRQQDVIAYLIEENRVLREQLDERLGGRRIRFTGDQRFFLSWAQVWQRKYREDALIQRLTTDPHSPAEFRVNGVVRNFNEWYEAFDVQADDALYLPAAERIRIW